MKKTIILFFGAVIILLGGALVYKYHQNSPLAKPQSHTRQENPETAQAISGELVSPAIAQRRPIAVMIENHPDARPQDGLQDADIVYEALAEGGITRFVAIFQSKDPKIIGPVRSARDYFAGIAEEYHAVYAHVGGSDEVIAQLKNNTYPDVTDMNEYYNGSYFKRLTSRAAPHNVYTSMESLLEFSKDKNKNYTQAAAWKYSDTIETTLPEAKNISIDFSTPSYQAMFSYNPNTKTYQRTIEASGNNQSDLGSVHLVNPRNLIVQSVKVTDIPNDPKLRIDIDTSSGGNATVFRDGKIITGTWKKVGGKTRYYTATGEEISLAPGQTWVMLTPKERKTIVNP